MFAEFGDSCIELLGVCCIDIWNLYASRRNVRFSDNQISLQINPTVSIKINQTISTKVKLRTDVNKKKHLWYIWKQYAVRFSHPQTFSLNLCEIVFKGVMTYHPPFSILHNVKFTILHFLYGFFFFIELLKECSTNLCLLWSWFKRWLFGWLFLIQKLIVVNFLYNVYDISTYI